MDETFILMCKEATEIQEQWKYNLHDKCVLIEHDGTYRNERVGVSTKRFLGIKKRPNVFWVPIQEDLQEIYLSHLRNQTQHPEIIQEDGFLLFPMADWYNSPKHAKLTITQAWLCFVMETCYNKQWNGETWEVIK